MESVLEAAASYPDRPLQEKFRNLKVVSLDTSFWCFRLTLFDPQGMCSHVGLRCRQLKLEESLVATRNKEKVQTGHG